MRSTFAHADDTAQTAFAALDAAGFELDIDHPCTLTALDTFDGLLRAAGLHLLVRSTPDPQLILVGPGDGPSAHLAVTKPPVSAGDLPPGPFRTRVQGAAEGRALLPLLTMTSRRRVANRRDKRGKVVATVIVHHELTVADAPAEPPPWAAEVVGVAGHDDEYTRTCDALRAAGLRAVGTDLVDVVGEASGIDLGGRTSSPTVPMHRDDPAFEAVRRVLLNLADTIDANVAGTIDDIDPEFLHELRVAVRRTRAVLAQTRGIIPDDIRDAYRDAFGWIGTVTSPARDLDVEVIEWPQYVAPLPDGAAAALTPVLGQIERQRKAAHRALATALRSTRFTRLMADWRAWLTEPQDAPVEGLLPVGPLIAHRITKAQRRLLEHGRAIGPESPPERLHDLRKDAKKLRYLIECFGGVLPSKKRRVFVRRLKDLQDNLGKHQDAEVHVAQLEALAVELNTKKPRSSARGRNVDTEALLAMGQLIARLEQVRLDERTDFAERFAAYDSKPTRTALDDLLAKAAST